LVRDYFDHDGSTHSSIVVAIQLPLLPLLLLLLPLLLLMLSRLLRLLGLLLVPLGMPVWLHQQGRWHLPWLLLCAAVASMLNARMSCAFS